MCPFFIFCLLFAPMPPAPAVPDGAGGFVPFTNARVLPDGSLRSYDPAIDGIEGPDGSVYFPVQPYPPYVPQGHVTVGPPEPYDNGPAPRRSMPRKSTPRAAQGAIAPKSGEPWSGCYDDSGAPRNPVPPDCVTQSAPPLSRESYEPDHDRSM